MSGESFLSRNSRRVRLLCRKDRLGAAGDKIRQLRLGVEINVAFTRRTALLLVSLALSGCVTPTKFKLSYVAQPEVLPVLAAKTFSLEVIDERPFVTHEGKVPGFLGRIRSNYGIPRDVINDKKVSLADQMKGDLRQELLSLGLVESSSPSNHMKLRIRDWNFDTGVNSRIWYDVEVSVRNAASQKLVTDRVKDEKVLVTANVLGASPERFMKELPTIYAELIRELVRDNASILAALQTDS